MQKWIHIQSSPHLVTPANPTDGRTSTTPLCGQAGAGSGVLEGPVSGEGSREADGGTDAVAASADGGGVGLHVSARGGPWLRDASTLGLGTILVLLGG
jgi:hypothetical protein